MSVSASRSSMARRRVSKSRPPGALVATISSSLPLPYLDDTSVSTGDCNPLGLRRERIGDRLPSCLSGTLRSCCGVLSSVDLRSEGCFALSGSRTALWVAYLAAVLLTFSVVFAGGAGEDEGSTAPWVRPCPSWWS